MTPTDMILSAIFLMLVLIWFYLRWIYLRLEYPAEYPVNAYGENLTDAIQNSIVRGQRGISTYDH